MIRLTVAVAISAAAAFVFTGWFSYFRYPEPIDIPVKTVKTFTIEPD